MKGECENCGLETEVHPYDYKENPNNIIYLCDPCFWKLPNSSLLSIRRARKQSGRTANKVEK